MGPKVILTYRLGETGKMLVARGVEGNARGSDGELAPAKCQANKDVNFLLPRFDLLNLNLMWLQVIVI